MEHMLMPGVWMYPLLLAPVLVVAVVVAALVTRRRERRTRRTPLAIDDLSELLKRKRQREVNNVAWGEPAARE